MNLTRLKIGRWSGDLKRVAVKLPRGAVTVFEEGQEEVAKAFFKDYSRYGKDCVNCGVLWGAAGTIAAIIIAKKLKKYKEEAIKEIKETEEMEEADAE